ncbi:NAD(P)-binding protein [Lentithecium fluviatile CBS 122367]|uniref:NAD(P)-binding protein n=1 Tax=Lentithecium fluviatile CBS 122367 TaxID=1168545 RepID=A0A6G1IE19_9PLEO|nr:NAD(P)-binding protein [Lentithecium fluviatile CBS 122367]
MPRVIFITGTSRGLGHELAQAFLSASDYVVATARDPTTLSFYSTTTTNYLPLKLGITSSTDIEAAFAAALAQFGRIDIVINNAAYGLVGPLETLSDQQVREQFNTNFFPAVSITRKAISVMRTQSPPGGIILQFSSIGASLGMPLLSAMCASKKAVEIFTESVRQEMKPEWGIKLLCAQFGALNTDTHTKSMVYGDVEVEAYDHMDGRAFVKGLQATLDTNKVALAIVQLLVLEDLPEVVFAGDGIRDFMAGKLERERAVLVREDVVELARSCEK